MSYPRLSRGYFTFSYMKPIRPSTLILLASLFILQGCNPGVFIERLEASQSDFIFPMTGGKAEISLTHGDWIMERVAVDRVDAEGWIIDENGNEQYASLYLKDVGTLRVSSEWQEFEVIRDRPDHLVLDFGQSVDPDSRLVELYIENDYEELLVSVQIEGCSGYSFDRIEYSDIKYHNVNQYDEAWALNLSNPADEVLVQEFDVFNADVFRMIDIPATAVTSEDLPHPHWQMELVRYMGGETFDMPLPSPFLKNGELVFGDMTLPFIYGEHQVETYMPDEKVCVGLQPGESRLRVFWEYEEYGVDYTVWLKHEGDGKPLSFSGTMHSKTYTGKWVHLYGQNSVE